MKRSLLLPAVFAALGSVTRDSRGTTPFTVDVPARPALAASKPAESICSINSSRRSS